MSPGNYRAINSARCWSLYLLLIYRFNDYILLMWPHFRNYCNPCLLSHTETKHKQLVPISFTARTVSLSSPLQKLFCFAALNTELVLICEHIWQECLQSMKGCSTAPEPEEAWEVVLLVTYPNFIPAPRHNPQLHKSEEKKPGRSGGPHWWLYELFLFVNWQISALNEQTDHLCQVTHISSCLRPWVSGQALQPGAGSVPSWKIGVLRLLTVQGICHVFVIQVQSHKLVSLPYKYPFVSSWFLPLNLHCLVLVPAYVYPQLSVQALWFPDLALDLFFGLR